MTREDALFFLNRFRRRGINEKLFDALGVAMEALENERPIKRKERVMEYKAHEIVIDYINRHLDKSDNITEFDVYTVWKCKALQNWKFLISSTLLDGMYYELTFNGDRSEWYLDAYKKFENRVIPEITKRSE